MSRVDVPTLQCDRCKSTTQKLQEMSRYSKLHRPGISGTEKWDLCPTCTAAFREFMAMTEREG